MRKYLTVADAGLALRLYHEAQDRGRFVRRVKIWHKYKSLTAIQQYIRKSPGVRNEAELLARVSNVDTYPAYITWEDSHSGGSIPPETPPPDVVRSHTGFILHQPTPQMDQPSIRHVSGREPSPSSIEEISHEGQAVNQTYDLDDLTDTDDVVFVEHVDALETNDAGGRCGPEDSAELSANQISGLDAVVDPFMPYADFGPAIYTDPSFWNPRLSVTPAIEDPCQASQERSSNQQAETLVRRALGSNQELKDACSSGCIKAFLEDCCEAMFHHNRQDEQACSTCIDAAVQSYNHIIERHFEWTLTTLNNMLFLLQLYGQKLLAEDILTSIYAWITMQGSEYAIARTIAFKKDMPKPTEQPNFDLDMLRSVCDEFAGPSTAESPLLLTAKFNLAWASLEMATTIKDAQQRGQALQVPRDILEGIRSACERVFGPFQMQTITCMATLARVYLNTNQGIMAELLINDVTRRVEGSFSRTHPLYWELKNRQALFTMKLAEMDVRPDRTNEYWERGENLLRDVLVWRASDSGLGMSNPQTARTIEVLKHWLKQQGKMMEAENVSGWLVEKLEGA